MSGKNGNKPSNKSPGPDTPASRSESIPNTPYGDNSNVLNDSTYGTYGTYGHGSPSYITQNTHTPHTPSSERPSEVTTKTKILKKKQKLGTNSSDEIDSDDETVAKNLGIAFDNNTDSKETLQEMMESYNKNSKEADEKRVNAEKAKRNEKKSQAIINKVERDRQFREAQHRLLVAKQKSQSETELSKTQQDLNNINKNRSARVKNNSQGKKDFINTALKVYLKQIKSRNSSNTDYLAYKGEQSKGDFSKIDEENKIFHHSGGVESELLTQFELSQAILALPDKLLGDFISGVDLEVDLLQQYNIRSVHYQLLTYYLDTAYKVSIEIQNYDEEDKLRFREQDLSKTWNQLNAPNKDHATPPIARKKVTNIPFNTLYVVSRLESYLKKARKDVGGVWNTQDEKDSNYLPYHFQLLQKISSHHCDEIVQKWQKYCTRVIDHINVYHEIGPNNLPKKNSKGLYAVKTEKGYEEYQSKFQKDTLTYNRKIAERELQLIAQVKTIKKLIDDIGGIIDTARCANESIGSNVIRKYHELKKELDENSELENDVDENSELENDVDAYFSHVREKYEVFQKDALNHIKDRKNPTAEQKKLQNKLKQNLYSIPRDYVELEEKNFVKLRKQLLTDIIRAFDICFRDKKIERSINIAQDGNVTIREEKKVKGNVQYVSAEIENLYGLDKKIVKNIVDAYEKKMGIKVSLKETQDGLKIGRFNSIHLANNTEQVNQNRQYIRQLSNVTGNISIAPHYLQVLHQSIALLEKVKGKGNSNSNSNKDIKIDEKLETLYKEKQEISDLYATINQNIKKIEQAQKRLKKIEAAIQEKMNSLTEFSNDETLIENLEKLYQESDDIAANIQNLKEGELTSSKELCDKLQASLSQRKQNFEEIESQHNNFTCELESPKVKKRIDKIIQENRDSYVQESDSSQEEKLYPGLELLEIELAEREKLKQQELGSYRHKIDEHLTFLSLGYKNTEGKNKDRIYGIANLEDSSEDTIYKDYKDEIDTILADKYKDSQQRAQKISDSLAVINIAAGDAEAQNILDKLRLLNIKAKIEVVGQEFAIISSVLNSKHNERKKKWKEIHREENNDRYAPNNEWLNECAKLNPEILKKIKNIQDFLKKCQANDSNDQVKATKDDLDEIEQELAEISKKTINKGGTIPEDHDLMTQYEEAVTNYIADKTLDQELERLKEEKSATQSQGNMFGFGGGAGGIGGAGGGGSDSNENQDSKDDTSSQDENDKSTGDNDENSQSDNTSQGQEEIEAIKNRIADKLGDLKTQKQLLDDEFKKIKENQEKQKEQEVQRSQHIAELEALKQEKEALEKPEDFDKVKGKRIIELEALISQPLMDEHSKKELEQKYEKLTELKTALDSACDEWEQGYNNKGESTTKEELQSMETTLDGIFSNDEIQNTAMKHFKNYCADYNADYNLAYKITELRARKQLLDAEFKKVEEKNEKEKEKDEKPEDVRLKLELLKSQRIDELDKLQEEKQEGNKSSQKIEARIQELEKLTSPSSKDELEQTYKKLDGLKTELDIACYHLEERYSNRGESATTEELNLIEKDADDIFWQNKDNNTLKAFEEGCDKYNRDYYAIRLQKRFRTIRNPSLRNMVEEARSGIEKFSQNINDKFGNNFDDFKSSLNTQLAELQDKESEIKARIAIITDDKKVIETVVNQKIEISAGKNHSQLKIESESYKNNKENILKSLTQALTVIELKIENLNNNKDRYENTVRGLFEMKDEADRSLENFDKDIKETNKTRDHIVEKNKDKSQLKRSVSDTSPEESNKWSNKFTTYSNGRMLDLVKSNAKIAPNNKKAMLERIKSNSDNKERS